MGKLAKRRKAGAICSKCQSPDYTIKPNDLGKDYKPNITCGQCGNIWQYGYDGGIYKELA